MLIYCGEFNNKYGIHKVFKETLSIDNYFSKNACTNKYLY
ncbi:MAG: hypothetical protein ACI9OE_000761 [Mariniflexile sp.]|jgi:hypothetical protein